MTIASRRSRYAPLAFFFLSVAACSGAGMITGATEHNRAGSEPTSGEASPDPQAPEADGSSDSTDTPVWVNAAALTCDWSGAASATEALIVCGLNDGAGAPIRPDSKTVVSWTVTDATGVAVETPQQESSSTARVERVFTIAATKLTDRAIVAWIGTAQPAPKGLKLDTGLVYAHEIAACATGDTVANCIEQMTTPTLPLPNNSPSPSPSPLSAGGTNVPPTPLNPP